MDGWINGLMESMDGLIKWTKNEKIRNSRNLERKERERGGDGGGGNGGRWEKTRLKNTTPKTHVAVPLTSYMVSKVNVNVNVDLCFTLSCELVGRLQNLKRLKLYTAHMPGRWRGGRWSEKCQLGRCTNQRWGAQAQIHQKYVLAQWFVDITDFFPNTTVFYN